MIGDYLSDLPNLAVIFKRFSHKLDAVFGSCSMKFSASKYKPGAIVENHADLFAVKSTGVPIKMNCGKAMFSFISDPGLPAFLLFFVLNCQAIFKKNMVDGVVRYMSAIFVLDNLFEASCSGILLFVDF